MTLHAFAQHGQLTAMTQNSNGTVQYSYVTKHDPGSVVAENYFIHSAHILRPGDAIRVVMEHQDSINFAELVVVISRRDKVVTADWNNLEHYIENGVKIYRVPFEQPKEAAKLELVKDKIADKEPSLLELMAEAAEEPEIFEKPALEPAPPEAKVAPEPKRRKKQEEPKEDYTGRVADKPGPPRSETIQRPKKLVNRRSPKNQPVAEVSPPEGS